MVSAQDAHIKDLVDTATAALRAGNPQAALKLMRQAEAAAPGDVAVQMQLALVLRSSGDLEAALGALDAALAIDPYLLLALLSKGWILEKLERSRAAAAVYRNALKIVPPGEPPASLKGPVERARALVAQDADALAAHLQARTSAVRA